MQANVYNVLLILLPVLFFVTVGVFIYRFVRRSNSWRKSAPPPGTVGGSKIFTDPDVPV